MEIKGGSGTILMGIVVDAVSEILNIKAEDMEDAPTFGTNLNTEYIPGIAKMDGGVKILLDIDTVLNTGELAAMELAA